MGSTLGVGHRMWRQEEKLQIVLLHLEQGIPVKELSRHYGVNRSLIRVWCTLYTKHGPERLRSQNGIPRMQPSSDHIYASATAKSKKEHTMKDKDNNPLSDPQYVNRIVGKLVREYREKAGYSQNELSDQSGLSQQHISQVELGKRNIGVDQLIRLGLLLDFTLYDVQARLDMPPVTVTIAAKDDFKEVRKFDPHISDEVLSACIEAGQVYLLWTPDEAIGVCRYSMFWQTFPFLDLLYIDESHRGMGYGKSLMEYWENVMKSSGHKYVMLSTQENETSRFFYEKAGYRCSGSFLPPEQHHEELMYVKQLTE